MATISGTSAIKNNSQLTCTYSLTVTAGSQSVSGNYTPINYSYYVLFDTNSVSFSGTTRPNAGTVNVVINGTTVASKVVPLTNGIKDGTYIIATTSGTVNVPHNADGTKTLSYSISMVSGTDQNNYNYVWNASSKSGSMTLTTIPRASSISSLTSSTGGYLSSGGYVTVAISRASTSFTHKVEYSFAGAAYTTQSSSVGTSCTISTPLTWANSIPNSKTGTLTVRVTTYSGSTAIGSSVTKSIDLSVSSENGPTIDKFTPTIVNNGVPSSWGVYVQGYSQLSLNIETVTCKYGATVKSDGYSIYGHGINVKSKTGTTSVLTQVGDQTYTAVATDSRGWTGTKTLSINVVSYSPPSVSVKAVRCESDGTESSSGSYIKFTADYSCSSVSGKNSITSKSVTCNGKTDTTFNSGTAKVLAANCSEGSAYELTATVTDALGNTATAKITIPTATRVMNVKANKKGIAFGKFSEADDTAEFGWPVRVTRPTGVFETEDSGSIVSNATVSGAWARAYKIRHNGTDMCQIGAHGTDSALQYAYIGSAYNDTWLRVDSGGISSYGGIYATGSATIDNGISTNNITASGTVKGEIVNIGYLSTRFGNEINFNSTNATLYFGYRAGSNGTKVNEYRFCDSTNTTTAKGFVKCGKLETNDFVNMSGEYASIGRWRFNADWVGFYDSPANAANGSTSLRKGYITYSGNTFQLKNEKNEYIGFLTKSGGALNVSYADGIYPRSDAATNCGAPNVRWNAVYAKSGGVSTSDRNYKENIKNIDEKYIRLFDKLQPVTFEFNYNKSDRVHVGFISQDVKEAMDEVGLTDLEFAGYCRDEKKEWIEDESRWEPILDENGNPTYIYSLRYQEFIALNTKMIQLNKQKIAEQQSEIDTLKSEVAELKSLVQQLLGKE